MRGEISIFKNKQLILFLIASAFLGITQSIDSSVFNNFLNDTFHLTVAQRTILEIPRELPGFLVVFVSGLLMFLGDIRIAMVAKNSEDISPTLSMGISMDHAVSMFIPFAGSLVWNAFGYQAVFVAGAFIAFLNFTITRKIPAKI